MEKKKEFDAIIVGSGTAASFVVQGLTKSGLKLAVVEEREFGGTCALRGCQPKKYLTAHAEALAGVKHLQGKGMSSMPSTDWSSLQTLKEEFLEKIPAGTEKGFREQGVAIFRGSARMTSENEVTVGEDVLTAPKIVLATGSSPRPLNIPGAELAGTSDDFLALERIPPRVLFVGGGFVSMEFAHVAAQAGAKVTVLQYSNRVLEAFDPDLVDVLVEASSEEGIEIVTNESASRIEKTEDGFRVSGRERVYHTDLVISAIGRPPNLSVLEGGLGGVESGPRGVIVNEYFQSISNPRVYAVGDVASLGLNLATVADRQAVLAVENILKGNSARMDDAVVPSSVFTIPSLATVGLSEAEAVEKGYDLKVNQGTTTGWPSSKRIGEKHSAYKILIDRKTDKILGAHILRHNASEVINAFGLAIKFGITATQLREFPWAYPTYTSDLKYMVK